MTTRLALPSALMGVVLGILAADARAEPVAFGLAATAGIAVAPAALLRSASGAIACAAVAIGLLLGAWRGAAIALPSGPGSISGLVDRG